MNTSIWEGCELSDPETRAVLGDALLEREEFGIDALRWRLGVRCVGPLSKTAFARANANADANAYAHANANADAIAYADADANVNINVNADAHADAHANAYDEAPP